MLPLQGVRVQSLVGELSFYMPCNAAKRIKKIKKNTLPSALNDTELYALKWIKGCLKLHMFYHDK